MWTSHNGGSSSRVLQTVIACLTSIVVISLLYHEFMLDWMHSWCFFGVAIFLQESMVWMISSSVYPSKSCGIVVDIFTSFGFANILGLFLAAE